MISYAYRPPLQHNIYIKQQRFTQKRNRTEQRDSNMLIDNVVVFGCCE